MANKKTLERAVEEAEYYPTTTRRVRSSEIMGKPRGTITPDQWPQWRDQNDAAQAADLEDVRATSEIGNKNSDRRLKDFARGGSVRAPSFARGGPVLNSKSYSKGK